MDGRRQETPAVLRGFMEEAIFARGVTCHQAGKTRNLFQLQLLNHPPITVIPCGVTVALQYLPHGLRVVENGEEVSS